jgi:hypothetical protein
MWVFTKHGFFSVVCARQGCGKPGQTVYPERMMIRARVRGHLEALQQRFPELPRQSDIQEFADSDYAFRIFVGKSLWSQGCWKAWPKKSMTIISTLKSPAIKGDKELPISIHCMMCGQ